jgi:hypothetical protein
MSLLKEKHWRCGVTRNDKRVGWENPGFLA